MLRSLPLSHLSADCYVQRRRAIKMKYVDNVFITREILCDDVENEWDMLHEL